jgi:hypothetical protein
MRAGAAQVATDGTRIIGVLVPPHKVYDLEEAFTGYSLRPGMDGGLPMDDMTLRSGLAMTGLPLDSLPGLGPDGLPLENVGRNADGSWGPGEQAHGVQTLGGPALSAAAVGGLGASQGQVASLLDASDDDEGDGTEQDEASEAAEERSEADEEEEEEEGGDDALVPMGTQSPKLGPSNVRTNEYGEEIGRHDAEDAAEAAFNLEDDGDADAIALAQAQVEEASAALLEEGDDDGIGVSVPVVGEARGGIDLGDIGNLDL